MLRVTVFNASMSAHFSQLFAGLYDLQAAGLLEMHELKPPVLMMKRLHTAMAVEPQ